MDSRPSLSSEGKIFHIPDTLEKWPWPARISPHIDVVKADLAALMKGYPKLEPKALKMLAYADSELFTCCVYPGLNEAQLGVVIAFCPLGWLVDEAVEELLDPRGTAAVPNIIMDVLRDPFKDRPLEEHPVGEIARQWWLRVVKEMTPVAVKRLSDATEKWLLFNTLQTKLSLSCVDETIEDYLERRNIDVCMLVCMVFAEMGDADIPQEVWEHTTLETVRSLMCNIILLDNDMFSYNKEQARGDYHNSLHIMMRDQHLDLDGAFRWAVERHWALQEEYLKTLAKMPSWGLEIDSKVDRYIGGLGRIISGNITYSVLCRRYADGREMIGPHNNRVFELLPSYKPV
ncbi:isoprenoid synthase domain-containing protein [Collybia nuda]|uniref:Terpene synthase n=1 Tax=Collybia nuda TaxID=64659 RepID=A0A9P5XV13_9AGAR|nr:isoprenoid synthase domain-containing protein [Collybia nuda]